MGGGGDVLNMSGNTCNNKRVERAGGKAVTTQLSAQSAVHLLTTCQKPGMYRHKPYLVVFVLFYASLFERSPSIGQHCMT